MDGEKPQKKSPKGKLNFGRNFLSQKADWIVDEKKFVSKAYWILDEKNVEKGRSILDEKKLRLMEYFYF